MEQELTYLLAASQLAEMAYNANQTDHNKAAWEKAKAEFELAAKGQLSELPAGSVVVVSNADQSTDILNQIIDELNGKYVKLSAEREALYNDKEALLLAVSSFKDQLIEKDRKIAELEKSALSAKPTVPEVAPVPAPEPAPAAAPAPKPLTGAAKVAADKKAAAEAAKSAPATTETADDSKKKLDTPAASGAVSDERKERLMVAADEPHRQAALLSNTLADFDPLDVAGRRPVVEEIINIREAWKDLRHEAATGQMRRPGKEPKPTTATQGLQAAEIKLELQKTRVNISKHERKLEDQPDHSKAAAWKQELARLEAIKEQYLDELRILSYETT